VQALEWAIRYPELVRSAILIATTHCSGAQQIAFDAVGRHAIQDDPAFQAGEYHGSNGPDRGLAVARMLAHITYLSDASMQNRFGRSLRHRERFGYDFDKEFAVETYLEYQGQQFVNRFDANTYLYVTKAIDYFDISTGYGSLDAAMARVQGKILVLSFSSDWLYPPYHSEQMVYSLARQKKDVTYCCIQSDYGHDAFLLEVDVLSKLVEGFLRHTLHPERICTKCAEGKGAKPAEPPAVFENSIYRGRRIDYDMIVDLIEDGSRVLDIGCGNGELLCRLLRKKQVQGMGLELSQDSVVSAVGCGLSVVQADIDHGLGALPDQSFDYVVLSMTLQVIRNPDLVLKEMLRIGKKCIVSFPNFGLWRVRVKLLVRGMAPVTRNLPYSWYQSPNRHVLSVKDFREFCTHLGIHIEREIALSGDGLLRFWPNLFAEEALYVIASR